MLDRLAGHISALAHRLLARSAPPSSTTPSPVEPAKPQIDNLAPRPQAPAWPLFEALAVASCDNDAVDMTGRETPPETPAPPIDIIVPVYRGFDDTLACIYSVLTSSIKQPFELIVIDDCSPLPELSNALSRLAGLGLITLLTNKRNLGFVASVNRGMRCHPDRDVLLLNSDTIVYGNWLDRLLPHLKQIGGISIGSVTPLSNNATICSYPTFVADNPRALELDYAELDSLAATTNRGQSIDIPTGVGFCMLIPRTALDRFGYFDEAAYGRGYGEENDFCMLINNAGWKNLLALDVFVRHTGETSFGTGAKQAQAAGLKTLTDRYPDYLGLVHEHIKADPAASARKALDFARLKHHIADRPVTLCLSHVWGGGIKRHIDDRSALFWRNGEAPLVLTPPPPVGARYGIAFNTAPALDLPNLVMRHANLMDERILAMLDDFDIRRMEIHSLVRWPAVTLSLIPKLAERLSIPYSFHLHDYVPVCPQINLVDTSGIYCGEHGPGQCNRCLRRKKDPSRQIHRGAAFGPFKDVGLMSIRHWRSAYGDLLRGAAAVIAPSNDTAKRFNRYFPELGITVEPHAEPDLSPGRSLAAPYEPDSPVRIAIVGAIGDIKGSALIASLARDALAHQLPLEFVIIGYTNRNEELGRLPNVTITGPYREAEIYERIAEARCQAALLPSVWPETYSYTFSITTAAGLPTAVFDLGAPAERATDKASATVLPFSLISQPHLINQRLLQIGRNVAGSANPAQSTQRVNPAP